jgi:hypothetical protein
MISVARTLGHAIGFEESGVEKKAFVAHFVSHFVDPAALGIGSRQTGSDRMTGFSRMGFCCD